jgi:hypothetical protein
MRTALTYWGRSQASAPTSTLVIHRPDQINWVRVALQFALGLILMSNLLAPFAARAQNLGTSPQFGQAVQGQQATTVAAQGINIPSGSGSVGTSWLASMETVFKNFVNQIVVAKLVPVIAAYFVLKATLDGAAGENPLGSIVTALFLMSLSATMQLMQGWNSGGQYAMTDMLTSLWNYIAGQIMPAAAGLACVGAVINFVRHRPWTRLVFAAISFLSVSGLLALFRAMAA